MSTPTLLRSGDPMLRVVAAIFPVANADSSVDATSAESTAVFYSGVLQKRELGEFETFYSIDKDRKMFGFAPQSRWR